MTMADERTRALRFRWEFLLEMRDSDCLTDQQGTTLADILRHYPTGAEISQWALECVQAADQSMLHAPELAPEEPRTGYPDEPVFAQTLDRGPTTPQERAQALRQAYEFFRYGPQGANNLTEKLSRQIPYVLRHFPEGRDVEHWARADERSIRQDTAFRAWLLPQVMP